MWLVHATPHSSMVHQAFGRASPIGTDVGLAPVVVSRVFLWDAMRNQYTLHNAIKVTGTSRHDKQMPHRVVIAKGLSSIEKGSRRVKNSPCDKRDYPSRRKSLHQGFDEKHGQPSHAEIEKDGVFSAVPAREQFRDCSRCSADIDQSKDPPAHPAAQRNQAKRRVASGNQKVDGHMITGL